MRPLETALSALTITTFSIVALAAGPAEAAPEAAPEALRRPEIAAATASEVAMRGVDVSTYDRGFDFTQDWVEFGFAKATQHTDYRDPTFARNWRAMKQAGIVRGAYHYGHPDNDPIEEARHFLRTVRQQGLARGDLLVLDLEVTEGRSTEQVNRWAKRWLSHVRSETGTRPMFYSSWSFAQEHGAGLRQYPLWVAHYGEDRGEVEAPEPWNRWYVHQYAATSHDFNVANVNAEDLRALGYQPDRPTERTDTKPPEGPGHDARNHSGKAPEPGAERDARSDRTEPEHDSREDDQGFWEWLLPWA